MPETMELRDIFFGTLAGAAIVLMGAFYALFFALGRLNKHRLLNFAANSSFVFLAIAVYVLIDALSLRGFWIFVAAVMLVGYFLAPRAIWKLCVGTHADPASTQPSRAVQ